MYIIIWVFLAKPGREAEFEQAYGPAGMWTSLFTRAQGYLGTELLQDPTRPGRYLTIDRWASAAAYEAFRKQHADAYAAVDQVCEDLTEKEDAWGTWLPLPETD